MNSLSMIWRTFLFFDFCTSKVLSNQLDPMVVKVGSDIQETCPTSSLTKKVKWEIEKSWDNILTVSSNSSLLLRNVSMNDSGTYICFEHFSSSPMEPEHKTLVNRNKFDLLVIDPLCKYKSPDSRRLECIILFRNFNRDNVKILRLCGTKVEQHFPTISNDSSTIQFQFTISNSEQCPVIVKYEHARFQIWPYKEPVKPEAQSTDVTLSQILLGHTQNQNALQSQHYPVSSKYGRDTVKPEAQNNNGKVAAAGEGLENKIFIVCSVVASNVVVISFLFAIYRLSKSKCRKNLQKYEKPMRRDEDTRVYTSRYTGHSPSPDKNSVLPMNQMSEDYYNQDEGIYDDIDANSVGETISRNGSVKLDDNDMILASIYLTPVISVNEQREIDMQEDSKTNQHRQKMYAMNQQNLLVEHLIESVPSIYISTDQSVPQHTYQGLEPFHQQQQKGNL